jgi:protein SCO1
MTRIPEKLDLRQDSQRLARPTIGRPFGRRFGIALAACAACAAAMWPAASAHAQRTEPLPDDLMEVGVTEHLNEQIPLDLTFVDTKGRTVKLSEYFDGQRPVVLTMNYSSCPMLCSMQLDGLFEGLKNVKWDLGDQYRMVTVSIDPKESSERAAMTRDKYLRVYGRAGAGTGYAMLTGKNERIKKLADTIGFHYRYVPTTGEYAHVAVTMICTPDGRLSRYLDGVQYDPQTLRLALLEASEGKIGSPVDHFFLYCFQYDSATGKYGPSAFKLMRLGGATAVLVVGGVLLMYWRRDVSRRAPATGDEETTGEAP